MVRAEPSISIDGQPAGKSASTIRTRWRVRSGSLSGNAWLRSPRAERPMRSMGAGPHRPDRINSGFCRGSFSVDVSIWLSFRDGRHSQADAYRQRGLPMAAGPASGGPGSIRRDRGQLGGRPAFLSAFPGRISEYFLARVCGKRLSILRQ